MKTLKRKVSEAEAKRIAAQLVKEFSHLTLAQVYDALSFYYDNKDLIDKDIQDNSAAATPEITG